MLDVRRRLCCEGQEERTGVVRASIFSDRNLTVGCVERLGSAPTCGPLDGRATGGATSLETLNAVAGPGLACGFGAGGIVRCVPVVDGAGEVGTRYSSPNESAVCPPVP